MNAFQLGSFQRIAFSYRNTINIPEGNNHVLSLQKCWGPAQMHPLFQEKKNTKRTTLRTAKLSMSRLAILCCNKNLLIAK